MIRQAVATVRTHFQADVPILLRMDSGFFDEAIFVACEEMKIEYVCGGKLYQEIRDRAQKLPDADWKILDRRPQQWRFFEFEDQRGTWNQPRRAIFCQPLYEDRQRLLAFARPDTVLYTNLGRGQDIDDLLSEVGHTNKLEAATVIDFYHRRGADELVRRELKDFASEQLPFLRFGPNMAYYFTVLVAFFLFGALEEDVSIEVVPLESYPTTVRRRIFDQAGKIVCHAGTIALKVTQVLWDQLKLPILWENAYTPPRISQSMLLLQTQNRST